jgi:Zn-dependent protease with chaperone function
VNQQETCFRKILRFGAIFFFLLVPLAIVPILAGWVGDIAKEWIVGAAPLSLADVWLFGCGLLALLALAAMVVWKRQAVTRVAKVQEKDFHLVPYICAFLNAAKGTTLPVHYPRKTEARTVASKVYEWFVANEKGGNGPRYPLPALEEDDRALPYYE